MLNKSELKERKGERMYIDDDLTNEERKTQKKLRGVAREERDRGKRVKIVYRKIQINREWFIWDEKGETEEKCLKVGEKKRRRTGEKRYKKKVNKKVDGQRKRKPEKKHEGESLFRKSTNGKIKGQKGKKKGRATGGIITGVKLGIKEKRQEKGEEEECMERKVHIGNKWWKIMTIYKKERKTTRRRTLLVYFNGRKGERGARNWEQERGMEKEKLKTRWKMQRRRDRWNGSKKMDGTY
jgi:hypothetical protein